PTASSWIHRLSLRDALPFYSTPGRLGEKRLDCHDLSVKLTNQMADTLPPLNALRAFEAAARLNSVSKAAAELHVTHGAVSRQIRDRKSTRLNSSHVKISYAV